jgi:hypothetical protein
VKQVKIIFKGNVSKKEKEEYTVAIRRNTIESMTTLLEAMKTLEIEFADPGLKDLGAKVSAKRISKG